MLREKRHHYIRCLLALALSAFALTADGRAQGTDDFKALTARIDALSRQGKYAEAIEIAEQALALAENKNSPEHEELASALDKLAFLYRRQGRYAEAEPLYERELSIRQNEQGGKKSDLSVLLNGLADVYEKRGRMDDAVTLRQQSLTLVEAASGADDTAVRVLRGNLAGLYERLDRYQDAIPLRERNLVLTEMNSRQAGYLFLPEIDALAADYQRVGRLTEAETLYRRALALGEKTLNANNPLLSKMLDKLAVVESAQGRWREAAEHWRRSTDLITRRAVSKSQELPAQRKSEIAHERSQFVRLVKALHRVGNEGGASGQDLLLQTFIAAQWALTSAAAASTAQMAARGAANTPGLGALVREQQDLHAKFRRFEEDPTLAASLRSGKSEMEGQEAVNQHLSRIVRRIDEIDVRLKSDFPNYVALATPTPLSVEEVQAVLAPDEVLVQFLDTPVVERMPEETFGWIVSKTSTRWFHSPMGTQALVREVSTLRCGLDYDGSWGAPGNRCESLLNTSYTEADNEAGKPLPFATAKAYALYKNLFDKVEDLIHDKHLLIVPAGPLTQLPFQILVTTQSFGNDFKRAAWLVRKNAITVLPSVSSLRALRRLTKPSAATKPLIGVGNPLLNGPDQRYAQLAKAANEKQQCAKAPMQRVAAVPASRGGVGIMALRNGLVDVADIRAQSPLPETADELCAVARDLQVTNDDILLGARANEREIKELSASGSLATYRTLHFATHGVLAGQLTPGAEPGLILTPPDVPSDTDDGYLSASEVAGLKLDADWVILSACNTAAGGAEGAEALSGLARAFFYAGARALLVSHWSVDSDATVKLITSAVGALTRDKTIGRAEALRRAMLAMIDKDEARAAHPTYWAPFVVVGEGAAAK
jgi:CHAT domain-containing protein/tetratricopeptide (TPR) repeat protein